MKTTLVVRRASAKGPGDICKGSVSPVCLGLWQSLANSSKKAKESPRVSILGFGGHASLSPLLTSVSVAQKQPQTECKQAGTAAFQ